MQLTNPLHHRFATTIFWFAQNPNAIRAAMFAVSLLAALSTALMSGGTVLASPTNGGGGPGSGS